MSSCIIGAHYNGGVMLASDRRVVREYEHSEEAKLFLIHNDELAIACSGRTGIADDFRRVLKQNESFIGARTIYSAIEILKDVIVGICDSYRKRHTFCDSDLDEAFLLCGLEDLNKGEPQLFMFNCKGYCERIPRDSSIPYVVIGHARNYAQAFMKIFYQSDVTKNRLTEILSLTVLQTQSLDTSVGGKPNITFCERNTGPRMLDDKGIDEIIGKIETTTSALSEFHKRLFGTQEDFAGTLRLIFEDEDVYGVFQEYFLKDYMAITNSNREFKIDLSIHGKVGRELVKGKTTSIYEANLRSRTRDISRKLFGTRSEEKVVLSGSATIPRSLADDEIPENPVQIWNLTELLIDEQPREWTPEINWKDLSDPSKGIRFRITSPELILSGTTKKVAVTTECLYDRRDYIARTFAHYGKNVGLFVAHPKEIEVTVAWFLPAPAKSGQSELPGPSIEMPIVTERTYKQEVKGVTLPGNGFVVMWEPKIEREQKRSRS